jgi:molybdenum cofactor cytidylyltransferase
MLSELLPLRPGMIVALVGAGGKTTTMYRLAAEQVAADARVITTTTTHIRPPAPGQSGAFVLEADHATLLDRAAAALTQYRHITVATSSAPEGKVRGIPPEWAPDLLALTQNGVLLVEADGAKGRIIKAPATYEPVMPLRVGLVLLLASAEALDQPLSDVIAHRLELVEAVTGLKAGDTVTPQALARLETSEEAALKQVPAGVPAILTLTHMGASRLESAEETAQLALATGRLAGVLLCSLDWAQFRQSRS